MTVSDGALRALCGLVSDAISHQPDAVNLLTEAQTALHHPDLSTMDAEDAAEVMKTALTNLVDVIKQVALPRLLELEQNLPSDATKLLRNAMEEARAVTEAWTAPVDPLAQSIAPRRQKGPRL